MKRQKTGPGVFVPVLSADILIRVFSLLAPDALARSCIVCKSWNHIIKSSALWKSLYKRFREQFKLVCKENDTNEMNSIQLMESAMIDDWEALLVKQKHRTLVVYGTWRVEEWKGHRGRVECCRFQNGTIVTGSSDGTVRVWSVDPLHCLETYMVPNKSKVLDLEFDENKILVVSRTAVYMWRRRSGKFLCRIQVHNQQVHSMCYGDPEVFLGCADGTIRVFDLYSSRCNRIFRQHSDRVNCLVVDVESSYLVSGSADGTVWLCDSASGQKITCLLPSCPPTEVNCLYMHEGCLTLVGGTTAGQVYAWDLRRCRLLWSIRVGPSSVTALHAPHYDLATLVVGSISGTISIVDMEFGTVLNQFVPSEASKNLGHNERTFISVNELVGMHAKSSLERNPIRNYPPILTNPTRSYPPILCLRSGMTMLVTTHPNGKVNLWNFKLQKFT